MRKVLKMLGVAVAVIAVLTILMTSVAMAAGPNADPGNCPNPECTCDCSKLQTQTQEGTCECSELQNQYQNQNGSQYTNGNAYKYQNRNSQVD